MDLKLSPRQVSQYESETKTDRIENKIRKMIIALDFDIPAF